VKVFWDAGAVAEVIFVFVFVVVEVVVVAG